MCEGTGGIPFGDKNEDIKLTTCKELMTPEALKDDKLAQIPPSYPATFKHTNFFEALVNQKKDPFCASGFPGPNSDGDHCFKKDHGTF